MILKIKKAINWFESDVKTPFKRSDLLSMIISLLALGAVIGYLIL